MALRDKIELLAPAKNIHIAKQAILHGADAVYIGGSAYSARKLAGNELHELKELCEFAHFYFVKVFVAVNTILFDNELSRFEEYLWELHEIAVDAVIVQDLSIMKMNLPPMEFHASTQCNIRTKERATFFDSLGFNQIVLARELSLKEIDNISDAVKARIEVFVHGALCVCYSGQCNFSSFATGRSGNRGECAQLCRHSFNLMDSQGKIIAQNKFLLSLKDLNLIEELENLLQAGVYSFKIEGRLKDENYVKNVVASYHSKLEQLKRTYPFQRTSSGKVSINFHPSLEKSFNRKNTNYFLHGRNKGLVNKNSPKSFGEFIGTVNYAKGREICITTAKTLSNGDGLCFEFENRIEFSSVNGKNEKNIILKDIIALKVGCKVYRNKNMLFEKNLKQNSAQRKVGVHISFKQTATKLVLALVDEDNIHIELSHSYSNEPAKNNEKVRSLIENQISKLGDKFHVLSFTIDEFSNGFIVSKALNDLRREALKKLEQKRTKEFELSRETKRNTLPPPTIHVKTLFNENISNRKAQEFYNSIGIQAEIDAVEVTKDYSTCELMRTKYCLKYELNACRKLQNSNTIIEEPLFLSDNKNTYRIAFDCNNCEMILLPDKFK